MCVLCEYWDNQSGGCKIHNTVPGGCKDFRSTRNSEEIQKLHAKISEMQNTIDCLTDENTKLYKELKEMAISNNLPYEPIEVAQTLITAIGIKNPLTGVSKCGYNLVELRQIAEHLLVYCNNNKDGE